MHYFVEGNPSKIYHIYSIYTLAAEIWKIPRQKLWAPNGPNLMIFLIFRSSSEVPFGVNGRRHAHFPACEKLKVASFSMKSPVCKQNRDLYTYI